MADNELGKSTYMLCAACHGADGKGVANVGPPLAENQWVNGPAENLIKIQLRGIEGPIHPQEGVEWAEAPMMAPNAYLSDDQIASVLTYVRSNFGNDASAVEVAAVAALREEEVGKPMLKEEDLLKPEPEVDEVIEEMPAKDLPDPPRPENSSGLPSIAWLGLLIFLIIIGLSVLKSAATRNS